MGGSSLNSIFYFLLFFYVFFNVFCVGFMFPNVKEKKRLDIFDRGVVGWV